MRAWFLRLLVVGLCMGANLVCAHGGSNPACQSAGHPAISFVEFPSLDLAAQPPVPLIVKGKLKLPVKYSWKDRCFLPRDHVAAVVILHGSTGIDSRGEFYAQGLNAAGIATLEIDMWGARNVLGPENRPALPILTYPDAFAALAFLSAESHIDPAQIGVLGFSWGAAVSLASAEQLYATQFGGGLRFAAHVANYPPCYAVNNAAIPVLIPLAEKGAQFITPTGAPMLIQTSTEDDYDNGPEHCQALAETVNAAYGDVIEVAVYEGAYHAWDRLQPAISVPDPFGDEGSIFSTGVTPIVEIIPNVDDAYASRRKAVLFLRRNLCGDCRY